jgi:hypothetical protein
VESPIIFFFFFLFEPNHSLTLFPNNSKKKKKKFSLLWKGQKYKAAESDYPYLIHIHELVCVCLTKRMYGPMGMASLQLSLPSTCRFRQRPVRCASDERQGLFNRIAPVYDNVHPLYPLSFFSFNANSFLCFWTLSKGLIPPNFL